MKLFSYYFCAVRLFALLGILTTPFFVVASSPTPFNAHIDNAVQCLLKSVPENKRKKQEHIARSITTSRNARMQQKHIEQFFALCKKNSQEDTGEHVSLALSIRLAESIGRYMQTRLSDAIVHINQLLDFWKSQERHQVRYFFSKSLKKLVSGPSQEDEIKSHIATLEQQSKSLSEQLGRLTIQLNTFRANNHKAEQISWCTSICDILASIVGLDKESFLLGKSQIVFSKIFGKIDLFIRTLHKTTILHAPSHILSLKQLTIGAGLTMCGLWAWQNKRFFENKYDECKDLLKRGKDSIEEYFGITEERDDVVDSIVAVDEFDKALESVGKVTNNIFESLKQKAFIGPLTQQQSVSNQQPTASTRRRALNWLARKACPDSVFTIYDALSSSLEGPDLSSGHVIAGAQEKVNTMIGRVKSANRSIGRSVVIKALSNPTSAIGIPLSAIGLWWGMPRLINWYRNKSEYVQQLHQSIDVLRRLFHCTENTQKKVLELQPAEVGTVFAFTHAILDLIPHVVNSSGDQERIMHDVQLLLSSTVSDARQWLDGICARWNRQLFAV